MYGWLVMGGLAYFFLKESDKANSTDPMPEDEPTPGGDGDEEGVPTPPSMDYTEYASWSGEEVVGESVVWTYQKMLRYNDGSTVKNGSQYIVIGNANHTSFLRANSDRGTVDIPARFSGGDVDMDNVVVFSSIQKAVDKLTEEPEDDGLQPQPQPDPDEGDSNDDGFGGLPKRPGFGGGFGNYQPTFGNGGM